MELAAQTKTKPDAAVAAIGLIGTILVYMSAATLAVSGASLVLVVGIALGVSMLVQLFGKQIWNAIPDVANRLAPWTLTIFVVGLVVMSMLVVPAFFSLLQG